MKAKRRLKKFDFSGDNAAVALVSTDESGAANGYQTLIMKSTDVVVELSMAEFLTRFFNVWEGDSAFIARMLGYSDSTDSLYDPEVLEQRVKLLTDLKERSDEMDLGELKLTEDKPSGNPMPVREEPDYDYPLWMADLSEYTAKELREIVKSLADVSGITITDINNANGEVPVSDIETVEKSTETSLNNEVNMSEENNVEMIEKSAHEVALQAAIEKAAADKEAELQEIMKGLQSELETFKAEKAEIIKAQFVEKAKGYEAFGVDAEELGVALMKMASDESFKVVEKALEKALVIAKAAETGFEGVGHDLEVQPEENTLEAILKASGKIK